MIKKETVLWIIIAGLVLIVLVLLMTPAFHRWNARRVNDIKQEYVIQDARTRVQTYEWFYDMYEQIKSTRRKADIAKGTPEERGIRMVLEGMISEYNAKARMKYTKAQSMPQDLPYQIEQ
jgi:hypothetical protein